ncbi:MAG: DUF6624 domain-containing protein [Bacteroidia bacterium]
MQYNAAFNELGRKGRPQDRFKAAIAWTLIGEKDSAFFNLFRLAEKTNYLEFYILNSETQFQFLHSDRRWNELLYIVNPRNETYNDSLAKVLLSIRENDQKYRLMLDAVRHPYKEEASDSFKSILKMMVYYDSINLIRVKSIIDRYGWLSQNEVGNKGNSTLWLVIQHSDLKTQEKYFPIMKEAVKNGKATKGELAYLEDRMLMNQGKKQLYGTQYKLNEKNRQMELWLIEDPLNLNKRRESVGLPPM